MCTCKLVFPMRNVLLFMFLFLNCIIFYLVKLICTCTPHSHNIKNFLRILFIYVQIIMVKANLTFARSEVNKPRKRYIYSLRFVNDLLKNLLCINCWRFCIIMIRHAQIWMITCLNNYKIFIKYLLLVNLLW